MRNREGQGGEVEGHCCLPVRPVPPPPSWNPIPLLDCTPHKCLQHLANTPPSEKGKLRQPLPMCAKTFLGWWGESVILKWPWKGLGMRSRYSISRFPEAPLQGILM